MKITKSRLLQIIREEVELHEKNLEENVLELDEEVMVKLADENNDGKISGPEFEKVVHQDQIQQGLAKVDLEERDKLKGLKKLYRKAKHTGKSGFKAVEKAVSDPASVAGAVRADIKGFAKEDQILRKNKPHDVIEPKKQK